MERTNFYFAIHLRYVNGFFFLFFLLLGRGIGPVIIQIVARVKDAGLLANLCMKQNHVSRRKRE